ncbi:hypothetical protein L2E82_13918 [Cichorium intybus]|uniref:Uncharacterized protein n=1 Tax=Cichorium intybus TaxID=13427 RepID=A0ACB9EYM3_CICIN|nr:hypothetical protein L2E82_13918 [Cichorium intybus]
MESTPKIEDGIVDGVVECSTMESKMESTPKIPMFDNQASSRLKIEFNGIENGIDSKIEMFDNLLPDPISTSISMESTSEFVEFAMMSSYVGLLMQNLRWDKLVKPLRRLSTHTNSICTEHGNNITPRARSYQTCIELVPAAKAPVLLISSSTFAPTSLSNCFPSLRKKKVGLVLMSPDVLNSCNRLHIFTE